MKRLTKFLVHLYPRRWRDRYGEELETLLEDVGHIWPHYPDIILEALRMRFQLLNWRFAGAFALAGLVLAVGFVLLAPPQYVSSAELEFVAQPGVNPETFRLDTERIMSQILTRGAVASMIQHPRINLYASERLRLPLEDLVQQFREKDFHHEVTSVDSRHFRVTMSITADPKYRLQAAVTSMAKQALAEHAVLSASPTLVGGIWSARVQRNTLFGSELRVRLPAAPAQPTGPGFPAIAFAGMGFGVLASFLVATIRHRPAAYLFAGAGAFTLGICSLGLPLQYETRTILLADSPQRRAGILADPPVALEILQKEHPLQILPGPSGTTFTVVAKDPDRFRAQVGAQKAITVFMNEFERRYRNTEPGDAPLFGIVEPPKLPTTANGEIWRTGLLGSGAALFLMAGFGVLAKRTT